MSTPIHNLLTSIASLEDADSAYLTAAAINLYSEALRRKNGRILYGPADVAAMLGICNTLLNIPEASPYVPARSAKPTAEEEARILEGADAVNAGKAEGESIPFVRH